MFIGPCGRLCDGVFTRDAGFYVTTTCPIARSPGSTVQTYVPEISAHLYQLLECIREETTPADKVM